MRRVVSVWLPLWPTDRLRRPGKDWPGKEGPRKDGPPDSPLVTAAHDGRRRIVAAADRAAAARGLRAGMKLAQAQAMVPGLTVIEADAAALAAVAGWCLRYAPLTAPDPPDGVWIDATGCAHLFGGEAAMLGDLVGHLTRAGLAARAAIADTPGAAWAVARHAGTETAVVPPGEAPRALAALPVAALRLDEGTLAALCRLGFDRIGPLEAAPRAPLARRLGEVVPRRLDQAMGRVFEPLAPVSPPGMVCERRTFLEPVLTAEVFGAAIRTLTAAVCAELERRGQGAR